MEDQEKIVQVNIEHYDGEKPIEVIVRNGEAAQLPEPLATKAPLSIDVSGNINVPLEWLKKRSETFSHTDANIQVSRDRLLITLTVNERDYYMRSHIVGCIQYSELFKSFHINDPQEAWIPEKLGQFLRLNRGVFADKDECAKLVSKLKHFTADVKANIEKHRDSSGSVAEIYRATVDSNLPNDFTINIEIFNGTGRQPITIEFDHYVKDNMVWLQLVSPAANEFVLEYKNTQIDGVLDQMRAIAPDIPVLEV